MTGPDKVTRFDVVFDAEGRNTSKFRNDVTVHLRALTPPVTNCRPTKAEFTAATAPRLIRSLILPVPLRHA